MQEYEIPKQVLALSADEHGDVRRVAECLFDVVQQRLPRSAGGYRVGTIDGEVGELFQSNSTGFSFACRIVNRRLSCGVHCDMNWRDGVSGRDAALVISRRRYPAGADRSLAHDLALLIAEPHGAAETLQRHVRKDLAVQLGRHVALRPLKQALQTGLRRAIWPSTPTS